MDPRLVYALNTLCKYYFDVCNMLDRLRNESLRSELIGKRKAYRASWIVLAEALIPDIDHTTPELIDY